MRIRFATVLALASALLAIPGCGAAGTPATNADNFGWVEQGDAYAPPGEGGFNVRWSKQLTDRTEAPYLPVELSSAEFDRKRKRVYIGTTEGNFFALALSGGRLFFYDAGAQIESKPAVDARTANQNGDNYVLTAVLFATVLFFSGIASKLENRWNRHFVNVVGIIGVVAGVIILIKLPVML